MCKQMILININQKCNIAILETILTIFNLLLILIILDIIWGGGPRGVMVKALDCRIVVSEFVLQSRYYIHFRANTLGKGMNPLILPAMG